MNANRIFFACTLVGAAVLVHCASNDTLDTVLAADGGAADGDSDHSSDATDGLRDALAEATSDTGSDAGLPSDAGGEEPYETPDASVTCTATPCALAIAGSSSNGALTFCAQMSDGTVQCWGANLSNRLGAPLDVVENGLPVSSIPRKIDALSGVTSLSLGGSNACAVRSDGSVWCWGTSALLKAGLTVDGGASLGASAVPTHLDLVPAASTVGVGNGTACITTDTGSLVCWGQNETNQLGVRPPDASAPAAVPLGNHAAEAARPTTGRTFAITRDGQLWSWGAAGCKDTATCQYLLGRNTSDDPDPVPTMVPGLQNVRAAGSGTVHSCAVAGKVVECWGANPNGQLGIGSSDTTRTLPQPSTLASVIHDDDVDAGLPPAQDIPVDIGVADTATCAAMGSGRVYCWGWPQTAAEDRGRPLRVNGFSGPVVAVAVVATGDGRPTASGTGTATACALLRSGAVECWGRNLYGALGRGLPAWSLNDPVPAPVAFSQN